MAEFCIDYVNGMQIANDLSNYQTNLNTINSRLSSVLSSLDTSSYSVATLKNKVSSISTSCWQQSKSMGNLSTGLSALIKEYAKTEADISGNPITIGNYSTNSKSNISIGNAKFDWPKVIGSFGLPGTVLNGIHSVGKDVRKNGFSWNLIPTIGKATSKVVDKTASLVKNGFSWDRLFGMNQQGASSLSEVISKKWDGMFGKATTVSEKVSKGAKWAGAIFTVGTEVVENVVVNKEGNSKSRAWAESIGEGAIALGSGVAIGVLTAAILPATAPAALVGAATVGATFAIDAGLNAFTSWVSKGSSSDWKESLSDGVLNLFHIK